MSHGKRHSLKRGDLITLGPLRRKRLGIILEIHDSPEWPAATIFMFDDKQNIRVNQYLFSLEKLK